MATLKIPILPAWQHIDLESLLRDQFHLGKKMRHQLRMTQAVCLDGQPIKNWRLPLVSEANLELPLLGETEITTVDLPIRVVYEDAFILIVNKPAGLKTHPNQASDSDSCQQRVAAYLIKSGKTAAPLPVHRLDEATSGLLLFAKNTISLAAFSYQLEQRTIHRQYLALTDHLWHGPAERTIAKPIGSDRHHPVKRRVSKSGQAATTHVHILSRHPEDDYTLVACRLETGRTHQIRVHLSDAGFPIIGDSLYGGSRRASRLLLHAKELTLYHPFLARTMQFQIEPDSTFHLNIGHQKKSPFQ